jgi:hypothetical protein
VQTIQESSSQYIITEEGTIRFQKPPAEGEEVLVTYEHQSIEEAIREAKDRISRKYDGHIRRSGITTKTPDKNKIKKKKKMAKASKKKNRR